MIRGAIRESPGPVNRPLGTTEPPPDENIEGAEILKKNAHV
jgi:hypothetical protein